MATAQRGLLAEMRRELSEVISGWVFDEFEVRRPVRDDGRGDDFFAELALNYEALIAQHGRGARQHLADLYKQNPNTIRNWMSEAKRRGMWATSGPGRTGQPTQKARDTMKGSDR